MDEKRCSCCNSLFFVGKRKDRKFCTKTCANRFYTNYRSLPEKNCVICKKEYKPITKTQKYCSAMCRSEKGKQVANTRYAQLGLASATVGAIAELLISIDLMMKGYEVYRALSPASPCDILARKNGNEFPIEVRTGFKNLDGTLTKGIFNRVKAPYVAAYVFKDKTIHYIPDFVKPSS